MKKHLRGIRSTRDGRQLTCVCGNAESVLWSIG